MTTGTNNPGTDDPDEKRVPGGYRIASPDGWVCIVLDPEIIDDQVARIVDHQFKGIDNQPYLRAQAKEKLREQAMNAWANGGVELYLSLLVVGEVPLSASLLTTLIPMQDGDPLPKLEDLAIGYAADGHDVRLVEIPAGQAIRRRSREVPPPNDPTGNKLPITHLDYQLGIPNTGSHLLLSFSTPMEPLANNMVELFDTVALTLQWVA